MSRRTLASRFWRAWDRYVPMARNVPFWGTVVLLGTPTLGAMYLGNAPMFPDQQSVEQKEQELRIVRTPELPGQSVMEQRMYYHSKYQLEPGMAGKDAQSSDFEAVEQQKQQQQQPQQQLQKCNSTPPGGSIRFGASGGLASTESSPTTTTAEAAAKKATSSKSTAGDRMDVSHLVGTRIDPEHAEDVSLFGRSFEDVLRAAAGRR